MSAQHAEQSHTAGLEFDLHNVTFWKSLAPSLHIEDIGNLKIQRIFSSNLWNMSNAVELMKEEGYFQLEPRDWQLSLREMIALIDTLHSLNIPISFCFLYDEFWIMYMRLYHTIGSVLGEDFVRLPDFWAWRVDPQESGSGWHVHRDKSIETVFSNGMPKSISVWIPLSDATTSNGCMYVLPANRDPTYGTHDTLTAHWGSIAPDIRALPVPAGKHWC